MRIELSFQVVAMEKVWFPIALLYLSMFLVLKSEGDTKFAPKRGLLFFNYVSKLQCDFFWFYFHPFSCPTFVFQYNRWPDIHGWGTSPGFFIAHTACCILLHFMWEGDKTNFSLIHISNSDVTRVWRSLVPSVCLTFRYCPLLVLLTLALFN